MSEPSPAEQINAELIELLGKAAHDLKSPMKKISQYVDLLDEDFKLSESETGQYYIDVISGSTVRLQIILERLSTYISILEQPLNLTRLDLRDAIETVMTEPQFEVLKGNVAFSLKDSPTVLADQKLFSCLVFELFRNSVTYNDPTRLLKLEIDTQHVSDGIQLRFSDTGRGFPNNEKANENAFEPFRRLHGKFDTPGAGLGLSICRMICHRLGWRVTANGQANQGTVIQLSGLRP